MSIVQISSDALVKTHCGASYASDDGDLPRHLGGNAC